MLDRGPNDADMPWDCQTSCGRGYSRWTRCCTSAVLLKFSFMQHITH